MPDSETRRAGALPCAAAKFADFNKVQTPKNRMSNILTKATVLVLNRNWQAINVRTPQEAFCMMATNVATGLEIEFEDYSASEPESFRTPHSTLRTRNIRPVTW